MSTDINKLYIAGVEMLDPDNLATETYVNTYFALIDLTQALLHETPANLGWSGQKRPVTYGESITVGDPVYFSASETVSKADANVAGKFPAVAIALETASSGSHLISMGEGVYRDDARFALTAGGLVYLSTTAGGYTQTKPSTTDDCIQILGVATHADRIIVKIGLDYMTVV